MTDRRQFAQGIAAVAANALVGAPAWAQSPAITGRLSHHLNTTHFTHVAAVQFADEVKRRTNGAVAIEIFPAGQLYKGDDTAQALIQGNLDLAFTTNIYWQQFVPEIDVLSIPFLFRDNEAVRRNLVGPLGAEIARLVEAKVPVKVLGQIEFGPIDVWIYKHPRTIKVPSDFKGMKMRGPWESVEKFVSAAGGQPVNVPATDVFIALQQGTINGSLSNNPGIIARKWFEVADKYLETPRPWAWSTLVFSTSRRWWQRLNAEQQQIVQEAARNAVLFTQQKSREEQAPARTRLMKAAAEYYVVEESAMKPWLDVAQPIWAEYEKRFGATGKTLLNLAAN